MVSDLHFWVSIQHWGVDNAELKASEAGSRERRKKQRSNMGLEKETEEGKWKTPERWRRECIPSMAGVNMMQEEVKVPDGVPHLVSEDIEQGAQVKPRIIKKEVYSALDT